jgi:Ser/Thr protein kinase RdoA (MazF antagonist)
MPRWLAHGGLADGGLYVVTDLAAGTQPTQYTDAVVDAFLAAIDLQAGLATGATIDQDWSTYVRGVTFGGVPHLIQRDDLVRFSESGRRLVAVVDERCAGLHDVALPMDDLVHGDVGLDNALFERHVLVALVDAQAVGRGTRAVDIASMLRHAAYLGADPSVVRRLHDAGDAVAGPDVFAVCLAAAILSVLSFGTWNWPDDVDASIPPLEALLQR